MFYILATIAAGVLFYLGWRMTSRSAYESAEYRLLETEEAFELREYPDLMLVTTPMKFSTQGNDGSFGRLFRYISGDNDGNSKVAMTTPVFMQNGSHSSAGRMGFVIPKDVAASGTPVPTGQSVSLNQRPGGTFAVVRFAGRMSPETISEKTKSLREWIKRKGWRGESSAEYAGYDPPWTPGPFRRNEVLIRMTDDPVSMD